MSDSKSLKFYNKARAIFVLGVLVSLAHVVFWSPSQSLSKNILFVGLGMGIGLAVFTGFFKRQKWAKYALYVVTLFMLIGCMAVIQRPLVQQVVLGAHVLLFIGTLIVLRIYKTEAHEYFRTSGLGIGWKVIYGLVFVLVLFSTVASVVYQMHLKSQSQLLAHDLDANLIMEGDASPEAVETCKKQYASVTNDLSEDQLQRFCTCVALNLQAMMDSMQDPKSSNLTGLLSSYMAIGDACMNRIRQ